MITLNSSRWLHLGRTVLLGYIFVLFALALAGTVMFPSYARLHAGEFFPNLAWKPDMAQAALIQLGWPGTSLAYYEFGRTLFSLVIGGGFALLLLWRRPASWFILYLAFVFISITGFSGPFKPLFLLLPGLESYAKLIGALSWQFFFILFYLFPSGRPVPGWTRWAVIGWFALMILYPFSLESFDNSSVIQGILYFLVFGAMGSQIFRYFWRSDPVQRQQTKYFIFALFFILVAGFGTGSLLGAPPAGVDLGTALVYALFKQSLDTLSFLLIPLAITVAILRYRLWDIDLIIRRTLVYGLLSFLLGLVYFGLVSVLQSLFTGLSGQQSPLTIVISTLAIAALFNPLRRNIQALIDRRFFRQKYNAARSMEAFSAAARREVGMENLTGWMVEVVESTVQPEQVSVWIRDAKQKVGGNTP